MLRLPKSRPPRSLIFLRDRCLYWIFIVLAATAAGMAVLLALLPPAGHDQLWFLLLARRWLAGAEIYGPQAFDSNPPGIIWLSAIPVLLSRGLHLPVTLLAKACVVLAETGASLLSFVFVRRVRSAAPKPGPDSPAGTGEGSEREVISWRAPTLRWETPALLGCALVLFYVAPARDFGQRDQILSFLVLPYLLAAGLNPMQHRLRLARCAAGLLAAVGIALKPHHALVPIAVETALLLGLQPGQAAAARLHRLLRPEPALIVLGGLAYVAAIRYFTPQYFSLALPLDRETYWAIGHLSVAELALQASQLCLLALCSIGLFLRLPRRFFSWSNNPPETGGTSHSQPDTAVLIVAGCAATLAYFVQGTGWYYQQVPAISFFGAALALDILNLLTERRGQWSRTPWASAHGVRGRAIAAVGGLGALALVLTCYYSGSPFTTTRAYAPVFADASVPDPAFFAGMPPGAPVAILTTSVEAAMMPVERFRLVWAQRTDNLWLLPAILRGENSAAGFEHLPPDRLQSLDALQHRWMVEDLTRWRPVLVLVARCQNATPPCQELEALHGSGTFSRVGGEPPSDDLLAWFLRDPAFAGLWRRYRWIGSRGAFDAYRLI